MARWNIGKHSPLFKDETGKRYGRLQVIKHVDKGRFECICDCGRTIITTGNKLRFGQKSCGCFKAENLRRPKARGLQNVTVKNHIGERFRRLLVIELDEQRSKPGVVYWRCRCDCGAIVSVRAAGLMNGDNVSCGCWKRDRHTKHGHATKTAGRSPEFITWQAMLNRCRNPAYENYRFYGALGVTVCDRWLVFANFFADMGNRPKDMTLDRFPNPAGNYEPGNCRWATAKEQRHNRR